MGRSGSGAPSSRPGGAGACRSSRCCARSRASTTTRGVHLWPAPVQTPEGAELTVEGGQLCEIPAGHDAWVAGDEPYVNIEWQPSVDFARLEGGAYARVVSTLLVTIS